MITHESELFYFWSKKFLEKSKWSCIWM